MTGNDTVVLEIAVIEKRKTSKKPMKADSIKRWLKQYKVSARSSTITNAFMSALAPYQPYDRDAVLSAMNDLKQDSENLTCVYCTKPATTWDHLVNLVVGKKLNGFGHQLGNLVPCCSSCNSAKTDKSHTNFVNSLDESILSESKKADLIQILDAHLGRATLRTYTAAEEKMSLRLHELLIKVNELLIKADKIVEKVRNKKIPSAKNKKIFLKKKKP